MTSYLLPDAIVSEVVRTPIKYGLPPIVRCIPVSGGVVHHVWRLDTAEGTFYVKIRGLKFAGLPIISHPPDVQFESRATALFVEQLPAHFPRVVFCQEDLGLLILTDVIGEGQKLESLLLDNRFTTNLVWQMGRTVRKIHRAGATFNIQIRGPQEDEFFASKLQHKLGFAQHPVLDHVVSELMSHEPRQIILGDPSPKNIGVKEQLDQTTFAFFDLEDVHCGNVVFDVGFFTGHLILHGTLDPQQLLRNVAAFYDGYGVEDLDERLLKAIALGTVLYRLDSIVPYCLTFDESVKQTLLSSVSERLTNVYLRNTPWRDLLEAVCRAAETRHNW